MGLKELGVHVPHELRSHGAQHIVRHHGGAGGQQAQAVGAREVLLVLHAWRKTYRDPI